MGSWLKIRKSVNQQSPFAPQAGSMRWSQGSTACHPHCHSDVRAPGKTHEPKEPAFSEDRVLNRIGQVFMLLVTAAGFGAGYLAFGLLGMMFPGVLAMCFSIGVFDIVEPALRGSWPSGESVSCCAVAAFPLFTTSTW